MRHENLRTRPAEARLERALIAAARPAAIEAAVTDHRARAWASATYTGVQHELLLVAPRSPKLGAWLAALPDAELPIPEHLVASLAVDRIEDDGATVRATLTVLTIEA